MALLGKRVYDAVTLLPSTTTAAGALDVQGDVFRLPGMVNAIVFTVDYANNDTDAGDLLDVFVQTKIDGTNWLDVVHFTQISGTTGARRFIEKVAASPAFAGFEVGTALGSGQVRDLLGDEWRVRYTQVDDGDQDATFTFSVAACPM